MPLPSTLTKRTRAGRTVDASTNGAGATTLVKGGFLALVGLVLVALNLRIAVTSLGPLLDEVRTGLHLSGAMAGFLTTLPALAFAGFGVLTPWLVNRFSPARVLVAAMLALAAGQTLRAVTDSVLVFLATSAMALAGIAVGNVLMPVLVQRYFPHRAGLVTGAYSVALTVGASVSAATAVPIAQALGSWRAGLGVWAAVAAVAVLPWLPAALRRTPQLKRTATRTATSSTAARSGRVRPARTRLGWAMAIYFGFQALGAYATMGWLAQLFRDAGYHPQVAGLLLATVTTIGVPFALLMPTLATRLASLRPLVLSLSLALLLAYLGLAFAPYGGALLWVGLLAIGQSSFPMILAVIGLRARTPEGTVALSAFAQSTGYVIASFGPLLVGLLYEATAGWKAPVSFLIGAVVVQTLAGLVIARPRHIEDEL
ncbi:MAG TPA: MFS transporter [Micromonosporaceae bacterium]|nr:MFS transporter [Micromonosporaceae bacterium]